MGNSLECSSRTQHLAHKRTAKLFVESSKANGSRHSHLQIQTQGAARRNHSFNSSVEKHCQAKQKRFLSLSKPTQENSILRDSRCRKGIAVTTTAHDQSSLRMTLERFIKFDNKQQEPSGSQSIKKLPIKPRDLPRYSSQKTIPTPVSLNQIPLQSSETEKTENKAGGCHNRSISHLNQPQININYLVPVHQHRLNRENVKGNPLPFVPRQMVNLTVCQFTQLSDANPKKLKKVAMSRSHMTYGESHSVCSFEGQREQGKRKENRVENEEQQNTAKMSSVQIQQNKQNKTLLTDHKLMSQIKQNHQLKAFKEAESKYAVAYEQNGSIIERSINFQHLNWASSIVKEKYPFALCHRSLNQTLEGKVERQVQSKALIESRQIQSNVIIEQPFRFQTATDISYEERSDNTSFMPVSNNFRVQMDENYARESDQILQYCKPKINEKVLADLLRLPLKH